MTIKQLGGVFGRNPTFNDVTGADGNFVNLDVTNNANIGNGVGIGTTVPDRKLEIKETSTGAGDAIIRLRGSGANADNTPLGSVEWYNADTTGDQPGVVAAVEAQSDSSLGNKGKLIFKTHDGSEGGAGSAPVERMRIDSDGNVALALGNLVISTSGKGIDFSATAGTGTSELFDDYEEGAFLPVIGDNAANLATMAIQNGRYTKIGNLVNWYAYLSWTSLGSISGLIRMNGLPFTSSSASNNYASVNCNFASGLTVTAGNNIGGYVELNQAYAQLTVWSATTGTPDMPAASLGAAGSMMLTGSYEV